jgi:hypothetical protein
VDGLAVVEGEDIGETNFRLAVAVVETSPNLNENGDFVWSDD